jgi:hypothetical protein
MTAVLLSGWSLTGCERAGDGAPRVEPTAAQPANPAESSPTARAFGAEEVAPADSTLALSPTGTPAESASVTSMAAPPRRESPADRAEAPSPSSAPDDQALRLQPVAASSPSDEALEYPLEERRHFGPNGDVRRVWTVKILPDGSEVQHGTWVAFHANGLLYLEGQYFDGERHGSWTSYHLSGDLRGVGAFNRGKKVGKWIHWDERKQKRREYECVDGEYHGLWTEWDDQGQVFESGVYDHGMRQGTWVKRTEDGRMVETNWEGGRSIGER